MCQSELGDYDASEHGLSIDYLRDFDFAPNQSDDLLEKIMEIHKTTLKVCNNVWIHIFLHDAEKLAKSLCFLLH